MSMADSERFIVTPFDGWLVAWVIVVALGGVVLAAKGRWGWFFAGLLLAGLPMLAAPFLHARDGSLWARVRRPPPSSAA